MIHFFSELVGLKKMILFILFYQEKSKNSSDFKHVYIYQVTVLTLIVNMQTYLFGHLIAVKCTFH